MSVPVRVWCACLCFAALLTFSVLPPLCAGLDLAGTWAELRVLSDSVVFPLVGGLSRTTSLVQRVTVEQTGDALRIAATYCAATFDNGSALTTTINPTFVRSLPAVASQGSLDPFALPVTFAQSWTTELHGVRLEHPETDPLPTDPNDPRVFDQDGDGKPGITVHACALGVITGDVYVIERLRTRIEGQVASSDRIEGQVEGTVEQVILGASNALFLGSIVSRPDPVSSHSRFVLQRMDPAWTCDEILSHSAALFAR